MKEIFKTLLNYLKIFLAFEIIFLSLKYKILKYFLSYSKFIYLGNSKAESAHKGLNINQIFRLSNKIFRIFRIKSCLIKSKTLKDSLSNRGFDSCLVIGIKNDTGEFESHCWLEIQNSIYTHNRDISKFKVIAKI